MEREEAIERIKTRFDRWTLDDADMKAIQILIPELHESEDEKIRKTLIHIVKGACDKYGIKYRGEEISEEKLLDYLEKQKEQNPAEWSEEDSNMLHDIEGYVTGTGSSSGITKKERSEWLWNLPRRFNLQPKQEWSEEDETIIDCAVEVVEKAGLPSLAASLKSLKPHWKPSEEQIEALENSTALNDEQGDHLYSLLCDLRKLL